MTTMTERFATAIAEIDAANADDPERTRFDGSELPAQVAYARRMSRTLGQLYPEASEALRLAAYGQHVRRWTMPRTDYPQGRIGYLRWRTDLKHFHAATMASILGHCGYDKPTIARVQSLVRKERLKHDPEAQALEDTACVVFLQDYLAGFASRQDEAKVLDILRKTWAKMSPVGRRAARQISLPEKIARLLGEALSDDCS